MNRIAVIFTIPLGILLFSACSTNVQNSTELLPSLLIPTAEITTPESYSPATSPPESLNPNTGPAPSLIQDAQEQALPLTHGLDPEDWRNWPVIPVITQNVKAIYDLGQLLGRDPQGYSIFGDCQSIPEAFLGLYEINQASYDGLPINLQETVDYFGDSFIRESPTSQPGATSGALLWIEWTEPSFDCLPTETPVQCELRQNNPAFVLLAVGTHYESRNEFYLRIIIEDLLSQGIIPIMSTKADNREGDHRINLQTAQLAVEYNIPMWNFWALSADLPENGLYIKEGEEHLGAIYFNDQLKDRHRISALETIFTLWQAVISSQ